MHTLGGTVRGRSKAKSMTDDFGQCQDVSNLFIAGSSLIPTWGGLNPTFTVSALAAYRTSSRGKSDDSRGDAIVALPKKAHSI